jgi:hypothetical protein
MSDLKTRPNEKSVEEFLNSVADEYKKADSFAILDLMEQVTDETPIMWGDSIIGFGTYSYSNTRGKDHEWFLTGFSPRKQSLTLYIMSGFDQYDSLLENLGKFKTGKSCLYIKKLEDVDQNVLTKLVKESVKHMKKTNPS